MQSAAAAAYGSKPMVDRKGNDAATAGGRSAKTNATPLTFASSHHRDELGLNAANNTTIYVLHRSSVL